MATSDYWSSADLKGLASGGFIREDVMNQIIDILDVDLPLTSRIGSDTCDNSYAEWTQYTYDAPNLANASIDGDDAPSTYNVKGGARVGNRCQISRKVVAVTTRARNSNVIGTTDEFAEQLMRQTEQLRRDVEAISLSNQASVADNGSSTAGKVGSLNAWIATNGSRGATGADGGFSAGTVAAAGLGTKRALSEVMIRDACQQIYSQGFSPSIMMGRPTVIRRISEYMFTSAARIGIQQTETGKSGPSTAVGSVKVFITDFDVELMFVSNRLQPTMNSASANDNDTLYILTPDMLRLSYLHGYKTEPLAKLGLSDRSQVSVDWTLKVLAEQAQATVADIDAAVAMIAG